VSCKDRARTPASAIPTSTADADVLVGDCHTVLPTLPSASVDLVVTDPPYNIDLKYHDNYNDSQEDNAFLDMLGTALRQTYRVLKPAGSLFLFMGANLQAETLVLLKKIGFAAALGVPAMHHLPRHDRHPSSHRGRGREGEADETHTHHRQALRRARGASVG
jgi:hypothetical protein